MFSSMLDTRLEEIESNINNKVDLFFDSVIHLTSGFKEILIDSDK